MDLRGIGWLPGSCIAAPAGFAWSGNLRCWGGLRRWRRDFGTTVRRGLVTEQGYIFVR